MAKINRGILKLWLITAIAGTLLHFVYDLLPSLPTALISPVNESIWEHVKIIFWPFLAAGLYGSRRKERGNLAAWLAALLVICGLLLAVGWTFHVMLGLESIVFDIGLFLALLALGFWLACRWQGIAGHGKLWCGLTVLMMLMIFWFTFSPPDTTLFADPALADAWYELPC